MNRGKKSLAVDFKTERGRDLVKALCEQADVLIESYRPGVMKSLGLGAEELRALNPRLIYCSLTGWGQEGAMAARAGHDVNYLARTGALDSIGNRDGAPVIPGVQIADLSGGMAAVEAILAALIRRGATGRGASLDVAMADVLFSWHGLGLSFHRGGLDASRGENIVNGAVVGYQIYRAADDGYIVLGAFEAKFWNRFCEAVNRSDWKDRGGESVESNLYNEVAQLFASRTRAEWAKLGEEIDCCLDPVLTLEEATKSDFASDRKAFFLLDHGVDGWQLMLNSGYLVADCEKSKERIEPAPAFGKHTDQVLSEFGFSADEIGRLRGDEIVF